MLARVGIPLSGSRLEALGLAGTSRHRIQILLSKEWICVELAFHFRVLHERRSTMAEEGPAVWLIVASRHEIGAGHISCANAETGGVQIQRPARAVGACSPRLVLELRQVRKHISVLARKRLLAPHIPMLLCALQNFLAAIRRAYAAGLSARSVVW